MEIRLIEGSESGTYGAGIVFVTAEAGKTISVPRNDARMLVGRGYFEYVNLPEVPTDGSDLPADFPQREALVEAGLDSLADLQTATDEQIMDVKGIGEKTLSDIKKTVKKEVKNL